jgi:hypothetical protein
MQPDSPFRWTPQRHQAATLLADNDLAEHEIADTIGISRITLWRWKQNPDFAAQVGDNVGQIQAAMLRHTIAKKHKRMHVLDDLHEKAVRVVELRALRNQAKFGDDLEVEATQAAKRVFGPTTPIEAVTGLLVEKESVNNTGQRMVEWAVDTGLMREIRALHEQAAKELGQWIEKSQVEDTTRVVEIVGIDADAI